MTLSRFVLGLTLSSVPVAGQCGLDWTSVSAAPGAWIREFFEVPNGGLVGYSLSELLQWNDPGWTPIAFPPQSSGKPIATTGGIVIGTVFGPYMRWDGVGWSAVAPQLSLSTSISGSGFGLPDGSFVVANATMIGGANFGGYARWDGTGWSPFATGFDGTRRFHQLDSGMVIVTGDFTVAGGVAADGIALWTGSGWAAMGTPLPALAPDVEFLRFATGPSGEVYAIVTHTVGGRSEIREFNGSHWLPIGAPPFWGSAGGFDVLPNGDLVVAGFIVGVGTLTNYIGAPLRWDGSSWTTFGAGLGPYGETTTAMRRLDDDRFVFAGTFSTAGGQPSPNFAVLESTCPASTTVNGSGCAGSGGPLALVGIERPWIGTRSRARVDGAVPGAALLGVLGWQAVNVPLAQIHPAAAPGCALRNSVDATLLLGAPELSIQVPNDPGLVGVVVRAQVLQGEFAAGNLVTLAASNGLTLQFGAL